MLPSVRFYKARRCHVTSRGSGKQCKNPAAYGQKACRFHGAHRLVIKLLGKDNPAYKHGKETNKARTERRERIKELQDLEDVGRKLGIIGGTKTRGRKVKKD